MTSCLQGPQCKPFPGGHLELDFLGQCSLAFSFVAGGKESQGEDVWG